MRRTDYELAADAPDDDVPLYDVPTASYYLDIPTSTLRNWVRGIPAVGRGRSSPILRLPDPGIPWLSFVNLVEAHVLRSLRNHGKRLSQIRDLLVRLERDHGPHPLARHPLHFDSHDIFLKTAASVLNLTSPQQATMEPMVRDHLQRVDYGSGRAAVALAPFLPRHYVDLSPTGKGSGPDRLPVDVAPVRIDIRKRYGEAVVDGSDVSAHALISRWEAGESLLSLATSYRLQTEAVEAVLRWGGNRFAA